MHHDTVVTHTTPCPRISCQTPAGSSASPALHVRRHVRTSEALLYHAQGRNLTMASCAHKIRHARAGCMVRDRVHVCLFVESGQAGVHALAYDAGVAIGGATGAGGVLHAPHVHAAVRRRGSHALALLAGCHRQNLAALHRGPFPLERRSQGCLEPKGQRKCRAQWCQAMPWRSSAHDACKESRTLKPCWLHAFWKHF